MAAQSRDHRLTRREGHVFAFTVAVGFLVLAIVSWSRELRPAIYGAAFLAAAAFVAGVLVPTQLGPVRRAWIRLGEILGLVMTPVLMGLVYYLLITPIGLARRRTSKKSLQTPASYWIERDPLPDRKRMERQF